MNAYIFGRLIETGLYMVVGVCLVIGILVAIDDIVSTNRARRLPAILRKQPHITVLVYARSMGATIVECLRSINQNTYKYFDVVIVDDRSTDDTFKRAQQYVEKLTRRRITLYKKRKAVPYTEVLKEAYRKSQHGELVVVAAGDAVLPKHFLRQCAGEQAAFPADQLIFNTQYQVGERLGMVLPRLQQLSRQLFFKVRSVMKLQQVQQENQYFLCRPEVVLRPSAWHVVSYRGRLSLKLSPRASVRQTFVPWSRVLLYLLLLVFISYILYAAIFLKAPNLLLLSWLILLAWFLTAVWYDETAKKEEKLKLTFSLPPLFFIIYITTFFKLLLMSFRTIFYRG